jgi:hypothetical protein
MANPLKPSDAKIAEWEQKYKEAIRPFVDDEPLAVGAFGRAGQGLLMIPIIGQLGAVLYPLYQAVNKKRAAALPSHFLLAVTPAKVHAFKYRTKGTSSVKVKHEVAVWKRGDIKVAGTVAGPVTSKITFVVTEDGATTKIVCSAAMLSSNPFSQKVLALLGDGTGSP